MLSRLNSGLERRVALAKRRHPRSLIVIGLLIEPFLVERQIAGEEHHLPGCAKNRPSCAIGQLDGGPLKIRAEAIWLARARL